MSPVAWPMRLRRSDHLGTACGLHPTCSANSSSSLGSSHADWRRSIAGCPHPRNPFWRPSPNPACGTSQSGPCPAVGTKSTHRAWPGAERVSTRRPQCPGRPGGLVRNPGKSLITTLGEALPRSSTGTIGCVAFTYWSPSDSSAANQTPADPRIRIAQTKRRESRLWAMHVTGVLLVSDAPRAVASGVLAWQLGATLEWPFPDVHPVRLG